MKKQKNKVKSFLVFVAMLVCMLGLSIAPNTARAASDFVVKDGVLVQYTGSSSSVTVPASVKKIGPSAFEGNNNITYVRLQGKVKVIGAQAFADCENLRIQTDVWFDLFQN